MQVNAESNGGVEFSGGDGGNFHEISMKRTKSIRLERTMPSLVAVTSSPGFVQSFGCNSFNLKGSSNENAMELLFDSNVQSTPSKLTPIPAPPSHRPPLDATRQRWIVPDKVTQSVLPTRNVVASGVVPLRFSTFKVASNNEGGENEELTDSESDSENEECPDHLKMKDSSDFLIGTVSSASRAEQAIIRQQTERLLLSSHFQKIRERMRPPPPITLSDLEEHPLKIRRRQTVGESSDDEDDLDTSAKASQSGLSQAHLETFTPNVRNGDVKRLLLSELSGVEATVARCRFSKCSPPKSERSETSRFPLISPRIPPFGSTKTNPSFFVTNVELPEQKKSTPISSANTARSAKVSEVGHTESKPSSVHSGRNTQASLLLTDPSIFIDKQRYHRHAQHYRDVASARIGPPPKPATAKDNMVATSSEDVRDFLYSLSNRNGKFNRATIEELQRARTAQRIFFEAKKDAIDKVLAEPNCISTPAEKLLSKVRKSIASSALHKDNAERLDVYYDHIAKIGKYCLPKFLAEEDRQMLSDFLSHVREDIGVSEASIGHEGFVSAWQHFKSVFGFVSLLESHKVEVLRLLSTMYGISKEQFRAWLHKKLRRYEPKDFNAVFRSQDLMLGREAFVNRKMRLTINFAKHLMPNDCGDYSHVYLRVIAESSIYVTSSKPLTSRNIHWDKQFNIALVDDQSPIRVQVVIDEATCGEGMFKIETLAVGSPLSVKLPTPGQTLPNAKVVMELLLVQVKESLSYMAPTASTHAQPLSSPPPSNNQPSQRYLQHTPNVSLRGARQGPSSSLTRGPLEGLNKPVDSSDPEESDNEI